MRGPARARKSTLAHRLRQARELGGLSARKLDSLAGSAEGYAALIELGDRANVGSKFLEGYARVLGISLDWLVLGRGPEPRLQDVIRAVHLAERSATGTEG